MAVHVGVALFRTQPRLVGSRGVRAVGVQKAQGAARPEHLGPCVQRIAHGILNRRGSVAGPGAVAALCAYSVQFSSDATVIAR